MPESVFARDSGQAIILLSAEMRSFLDAHRVARLATASADGQPHVVPFCYAVVGDCIYFVIDDKPKRAYQELKRLQNIRANPRVAMVVDDYADDWTQLAYVQIRGIATIVDDADEFAQALSQLRVRYPQYVAMALSFQRNPLVRITPEQARLWQAQPDCEQSKESI